MTFKFAAAVGLAGVCLAGCTMKKQETPALTGPSTLATSVTLTASPDVLTQDGASQSVVTITARDQNGAALRNLTLRTETYVGGARVDFGTLSARSVVTDGNGTATVVYTAPASADGSMGVDTGTFVQISATPIGTDAANSNPRFVSIRLIPPGIVVPPDGLNPNFTFSPATPSQGDSVFFQACPDPQTPCATTSNPIASYRWDFGDGRTASGSTATHTYTQAGNFVVTLTITDGYGRTASTQRQITVGAGASPVASFVVSPTSPSVNETVNFNATLSTAPAGHRITDYSWNFGDGKTASGATTSHKYTSAGSYVVVLKVTDDAGVFSTTSQTVTVSSGAPTAAFVYSPTAPTAGSAVSFNAATSTASSGRSIVTYSWSFGDGTTGSGVTTSHTFTVAGTYNVILTVVDDQGASSSVTQTVTVS